MRCSSADVALLVFPMLDPEVDMMKMELSVNAAATALKQFLSDLSEPVIHIHLYEELKEAVSKFTSLTS